LTGWKLDVRSEAEAEDEARRARASLTAVPGVGDVTAELLYQGGFKSAESLASSNEDDVGEIDGIGPERAAAILAAAREHVARKRAEEEAAALAARSEESGVESGSSDPSAGGEAGE
jgi:N utilization substance protein A